MKKLLLLLVVGLFVSCIQEQTQDVVDYSMEQGEVVGAESLGLTVEEFRAMPDEVKEKRRMGLILSQYIELDSINRCYSLTLKKEEALKLGITEKEYESRVTEIAETNKLIKEMMERGDTIQLLDIKRESEKFFRALNK